MRIQRYVNGKPAGQAGLENRTVDISKIEVVSRINGYTKTEIEKNSKNIKK